MRVGPTRVKNHRGGDGQVTAERGPTTNFAYRPALDGLRSVAVYLVVVFHSGIERMAGGFIGVDIFFVLSGYLITNVLDREFGASEGIVLSRFYSRRVRRLLPGAIFAVLGTAAVSTLFYPQFTRTGWTRDGQASLLYISNLHFIREARDYFADGISQSPFLHFWSLSIEEQFYLGFPLLLLLLLKSSSRWGRDWIPVVGVAAVGATSLALQVFIASSDPTHAYYGTETRIYQMAFGAVAALVLSRRHMALRASRSSWLAPLGLLSLGLLATDFVDVSASQRGLVATAAAVATVIGLDQAPNSTIAGLLSRPFPVYLGRISYGTYLWHWPIILITLTVFDATGLEVAVISTMVATSLASLSYHVIEMPIRNGAR